MSKFELKLPQMGESIAEATLTAWLKEVGDTIELDEAVFEIATDKVDSEVPSEVEGVLLEKLFSEDDVIKVGQTVAIIQTEGGEEPKAEPKTKVETTVEEEVEEIVQEVEKTVVVAKETAASPPKPVTTGSSSKFYSPLVRNIAQKEGVSMTELDAIVGSGKEGRVTKNDIMAYLTNGRSQIVKESTAEPASPPVQEQPAASPPEPVAEVVPPPPPAPKTQAPTSPILGAKDEIIPMTRMGKLIAQHMAHSISTSAHVQSFVEADVTGVVQWRNDVKAAFEKREGEKLTFTPIFMEAVAKALKQHPMMNISVDGDNVIVKKNINIGMAVALEDGNLIVPVIKNADQLNLVGMTKVINDLAFRSRNNTLKPDEVQDGTYTVTNVGSFGSLMGTPIINQPQVGILALGAIRKVPSVIETPDGDYIGVRSKMFLSHSYDHRVVNGALGGTFVKTVADILENWDLNREF
ncbi:MAG: 2-oxo acid dehydrogenase subunit E2 [Flavobacteriaceae bacterium]|nr:2-oxo acid dehydrogenase subunit E2 [Flavobacteriaceae bacterium]